MILTSPLHGANSYNRHQYHLKFAQSSHFSQAGSHTFDGTIAEWDLVEFCRPPGPQVVRFVEVEDDAEEGGTSKRHSRGSWWKLLWKKKAAGDEDLPQISFWELLKLNQKDWYLVLVGVVMSAILGCLFPILAILFSDVLRVSYHAPCHTHTCSSHVCLSVCSGVRWE